MACVCTIRFSDVQEYITIILCTNSPNGPTHLPTHTMDYNSSWALWVNYSIYSLVPRLTKKQYWEESGDKTIVYLWYLILCTCSLQGSETPRLKDLLRCVKTTRWYRLGLELDIDNYSMHRIEADTKNDPNRTEAALTRVFDEWLKNKDNPVWSDVVKALKVMGEKLCKW